MTNVQCHWLASDNANVQGTGTPSSYYESQPGKRHIVVWVALAFCVIQNVVTASS